LLLLFSPGRLGGESRPGENNKSKKLPWNSLYDWYRKRGQVIRAQLSSYELLEVDPKVETIFRRQ